MLEQELKLHIPAPHRKALEKAFHASEKRLLKALYFDTPSRQLANAKMALRLRCEDTQWIQTLKMVGENSLSRLEFNHPQTQATLDLNRYRNTPAQHFFSTLAEPLNCRYETHITRHLKYEKTSRGEVEIALDIGYIRAGRLELPVYEIEFELIHGESSALFDIAQAWLKRYGLMLDNRSKAFRGDKLANMLHCIEKLPPEKQAEEEVRQTTRFWSAVSSKPYDFTEPDDIQHTFHNILENHLEHLTINAAYLAEVDTAGILATANEKHLYQIHHGLEQLLSLFECFEDLIPIPDEKSHLQAFLKAFEQYQTADVSMKHHLPVLYDSGMPTLEIPNLSSKTIQKASELVRGKPFQTLLMRLYAWMLCPATPPSPNLNESLLHEPLLIINWVNGQDLAPALKERLQTWHADITKHTPKTIHDALTKRHAIKRLQYGLSLYKTLYGVKKLKKIRKTLEQYRHLLDYLDKVVETHELAQTLSKKSPHAWFAVGFFSFYQDTLLAKVKHYHRQLAKKTIP